MSASSDVLHFGLGKAALADSVIVRWPDLSVQKIKDVTAGKLITLERKNAGNPATVAVKDTVKIFYKTGVPGLEYRHIDDHYVEFTHERLIPHSLLNEGPALAVGDLNGDRLDDFFVGGAKGQTSGILFQQNDGTFKSYLPPVFIQDLYSEDTDAAIFDADGDGDNDLYIVRGGNAVVVGNALLADRLLINNGKGEFQGERKRIIAFYCQ